MSNAFHQLTFFSYSLIAGIFFYHAFYVRRLSRAGLSVPYAGIEPLSFFAAFYCLSTVLFTLIESKLLVRANMHLQWLSGTLMLYFHLTALGSFLDVRGRWLAWLKRVILLEAVFTALSLVSLVVFDRMLLFSPEPMSHPLAMFPPRFSEVMSPGPVAISAAISLVVIEVGAYSRFLSRLIRTKGDRLLILGVVLSLAAVVNDLLISVTLFKYSVSFLFIANFVEIFRLTSLIEKANQERLRQLEHSLRLAQIGELSATLAHELNSPLSAIVLGTELGLSVINAKETGEADKEAVYGKIFDNCHRAAKRMQDIGESLRRHAHTPVAEERSFAPLEAIRETVELLGAPYEREKIQLHCEIPEGLPEVQGDPGRFQQVLVNLLQNAKDATEGKTERIIRISAKDAPDQVHFQIADNGGGIPPELLDRIFLPFFTTKARGKGTGIGLSFARTQIRAMGGQIQVESSIGAGTTFRILLQKSPERF